MSREADAQALVRLAASRAGVPLWRNNVGAATVNGAFLRWGLANETPGMNAVIKSGDLIGIRPVLICPAHVGMVIGQFVSREVKPPGWIYRGIGRERAQQKWADLVTGLGGDAAFTTGEWK